MHDFGIFEINTPTMYIQVFAKHRKLVAYNLKYSGNSKTVPDITELP